MENKKILVRDIGKSSFSDAWLYQENIFKKTIDLKVQNRSNKNKRKTDNFLIITEHNPVYTIGKSGNITNLLLNENDLKIKKIDFFKINRGGDITYHGPGQIMGYPIIDLDNFFTDINLYLRKLEEIIINTLNSYEVNGFTMDVIPVDNVIIGGLKRRRAVAKNKAGIIMLRGEASFSSNDQILIDELVYYIESNDLKAD